MALAAVEEEPTGLLTPVMAEEVDSNPGVALAAAEASKEAVAALTVEVAAEATEVAFREAVEIAVSAVEEDMEDKIRGGVSILTLYNGPQQPDDSDNGPQQPDDSDSLSYLCYLFLTI